MDIHEMINGKYISTHAPYVRGDMKCCAECITSGRFQPTPRMYGATKYFFEKANHNQNFNPRPVCTGRLT